jgi:hypothetical protein
MAGAPVTLTPPDTGRIRPAPTTVGGEDDARLLVTTWWDAPWKTAWSREVTVRELEKEAGHGQPRSTNGLLLSNGGGLEIPILS